jgi:hypothetical protein
MATKTTPKKKTTPSKKPVTKKAQAGKAAAKSETKPKQAKASTVHDAPQTNTPDGECPKGGAHEWTEDDTGRYCQKCLDPATPAEKDMAMNDGKKAPANGSTAKPKAKKPKGERKLSAIHAAAKVLAENGQSMAAKELIDAMAAKGYWTSPGGKTPHATL